MAKKYLINNGKMVTRNGKVMYEDFTEVLWTPANMDTLVWLDATDASTITESGGLVSEWRDKSGNVNHFTQGTAASRPLTYSSDIKDQINGHNAVFFDGINDEMKTASNPFGATISDCFVISMFNTGVLTNGAAFTLAGNFDWNNRWQVQMPHANNNVYLQVGDKFTDGQIVYPDDGFMRNNNYVLMGLYSSTTDNVQEIWRYGTLKASDASGSVVNTLGPLFLGSDTTDHDNIGYGEFIVVNGTITESDRQKLEGYIAHKYGMNGSLSNLHPYWVSPPTV